MLGHSASLPSAAIRELIFYLDQESYLGCEMRLQVINYIYLRYLTFDMPAM